MKATSKDSIDRLERAIPLLRQLPEETYFSLALSDGIECQGHTQGEVRQIRQSLPPTQWTKKYVGGGCNWWEYRATIDDVPIRVYACHEAPASCTAITETRTVKKQVALTFEEQEVEETVIVGWNCGDNGNGEGGE